MKKIALPLCLGFVILASAFYVAAKTNVGGFTPKHPFNGNVNSSVVDGPIKMIVTSGNSSALRGSNGEVVLNIDIEAIRADAEGRKPLNIALVIDHSGSMADRGKLEYAREAAMKLVDNLTANDRLAIIIYDDTPKLIYPSEFVTNPAAIKERIASITEAGSTNLFGGLELGNAEVKKYFDRERINQVILLSDGLANVGVIDPVEIERSVGAWGEGGVRVTTMGLGSDFNEDLMMGVADASGGRYYFIESPTQMASIYEKELSKLSKTVGEDVVLVIEPSEGVRFQSAIGFNAKVNGSRVEIPLGAMNGGQRRVVVAKLFAPTGSLGKVGVANVRIEYRNMLADAKPVSGLAGIGIDIVENAALVEQNRNVEVESNAYATENARDEADKLKAFRAGRKDEAAAWYDGKVREIREKNKVLKSPSLEAQANEYENLAGSVKSLDADSEDGRNFAKENFARQRSQAQGLKSE